MTNVMSLIVRSLDSMISNLEKVLRDFTLEMETKNKQTNKKHFPGQPQCECSCSSTFRTKITLGDRSFQVAAPKLWNALPRELRNIPNLHTF